MKSLAARSFAKNICATAVLVAGLSSVAVAQSADDAVNSYSALLQQIADVKLTIAHKEALIENQTAEIASLRAQIQAVSGTSASVEPMLSKMNQAISSEIRSDLPFNEAERNDRLGAFDEILADREARIADKWRRALNLFEAEVAYGSSVDSYIGNHPVAEKVGSRLAACEQNPMSSACALSDDQKKKMDEAGLTIGDLVLEKNGLGLADGNYIRYGRLALAYVQADNSDVYWYDPTSNAWSEMNGARAAEIRRNVKMAKGEAAINPMTIPVLLAE